MALTSSVITRFTELEELGAAWTSLLERSADSEPMLAPAWLLPWWRVFGATGGRMLRTLTLSDGDRLVGLAPMLARRHWYRPGLPYRRIEPLGSGEGTSDETVSEYLGLLAERGVEDEVAQAFVGALTSGLLGRWDELLLPHMNGDGGGPDRLARAFAAAGLATIAAPVSESPYITLPTTWEAYLAALPSSRRYRLTRSLRDFDAWAAGTAKLEEATCTAQLDEAKRVLVSLHGERWRADGHDGAFSSPRFMAFHDAVMPALLEAGALEVLWLVVRGEPVAAAYNLVWNGKTYFYQSGRKVDVPRGVRPGIALHAHAIRRAIEAGRREYDFLGGASRYKRELATAVRPLVDVRVVRAPWREATRLTVGASVAHARRWLRAPKPDSSPQSAADPE